MPIVKLDSCRLISWGSFLILLGIVAPSTLGIKQFRILELMESSLVNNSASDLFIAALRLVLLNTLRALPHYTGVLLIAEGLGRLYNNRQPYYIFVPFFFIPAIYETVKTIHGITYDFGIPAISLTLALLIMIQMQNMARSIIHKTVVFNLLLSGVEWLDIVPLLTGYWFGRGEISMDIKRIAVFLNADEILNLTGLSLFVIFVVNSFILARLLSVYTKEINIAEQAKLASDLQLERLENRSLREVQSLVHDLKTPLTTIQGLAGVLALAETSSAGREYAHRISEASDKMNIMISELLQDTRQTISAKELIEYAAASVPALNGIHRFYLEAPPGILIKVNRIKMARALANILANALEAVNPATGTIDLHLKKADGNVHITVTDNGTGISPQVKEQVWSIGFSTKKSSGLGLPFVRDTVEAHGGSIELISQTGLGTSVTITLPEVLYE